MKNILESIALLLVGLLSITIIVFIIQYNLIEDEDDSVSINPSQSTETKGLKARSYLDALEGYGDDKDIEVDATKESNRNTIRIQSELRGDALDIAIEDKEKSSYMENLNNYSGVDTEKEVIEKELKPKKKSSKTSGESEKLPKDEIVDEIGMAIDALDL